jgi:hypothetical protein
VLRSDLHSRGFCLVASMLVLRGTVPTSPSRPRGCRSCQPGRRQIRPSPDRPRLPVAGDDERHEGHVSDTVERGRPDGASQTAEVGLRQIGGLSQRSLKHPSDSGPGHRAHEGEEPAISYPMHHPPSIKSAVGAKNAETRMPGADTSEMQREHGFKRRARLGQSRGEQSRPI